MKRSCESEATIQKEGVRAKLGAEEKPGDRDGEVQNQ